MVKYVINRVILAIVTILVIISVTFFAMNAVPGGPFDAEKAPSPEVKQQLMQRYNLDKPLYEQYVIYLGNLCCGDFGVSIKTGRNITDTILNGFSVSAVLGGLAIVFALFFGIILGCLAAIYKNKLIDRIVMLISTFFVSVPNFVVASILILVFCLTLEWVPAWSPDEKQYLLPVIALGVYPMSSIIRFTRTSMLEVLNQNFIRTARAKGVSELKVIFKHALRNALIPVMTYVGPMAAYVITGSVVVESVFTIGGLGSEFVQSITNRDYPMIMGTTIFLAVLIVLVTLLSDILYKVIDPRIKFN